MTKPPKKPPTKATTTKTTSVFVDAVENGRARLLLGADAFTVPAALLPDDAGEGSWLKVSATVTPPQAAPDPLRGKLGRDDPGGPIKL